MDGHTAFSSQLTGSPAVCVCVCVCVCSAEPVFIIHKMGIVIVVVKIT